MNILHLNTSEMNGGAARAAWRLHKGLRLINIDSNMLVRDKISSDPTVVRYIKPSGPGKLFNQIRQSILSSDVSRYINSRPKGFETFSDDRTALKRGFAEHLLKADIYHLHWISGFVDLPSFFRIIKKPVVWTLHDMFPFTGGCHYSNGCEKYKVHCSQCPQLGSVSDRDLSSQIWERKQKYISRFKNKLFIRADSHWLTAEAKQSSLFRDLDIDTIHYGIETDEFIMRDKIACRKALGIPDGFKVIAFGAPGIDNPRKGFAQLASAINLLTETYPKLFIVSFGSGASPAGLAIPQLHMGHVSSNTLLSVIYNCADVFVIPSLHEAFGQTALEAMSCGIPVAGFATGGIPDMIENGITGYLAETGNVADLAGSIARIIALDEAEYQVMVQNCRAKVLGEFTIFHQAEKYLDLYRNILNY
jgi:glycosyltransferase involved in cell wall biosynthesis